MAPLTGWNPEDISTNNNWLQEKPQLRDNLQTSEDKEHPSIVSFLWIASKRAAETFAMLKQPTFLFLAFSMRKIYPTVFWIFQNQMDMDYIATWLEIMGPALCGQKNFRIMFWGILVQNSRNQKWKQLRYNRKTTLEKVSDDGQEVREQRRYEGPPVSGPQVTEWLSGCVAQQWRQPCISLLVYMNRS